MVLACRSHATKGESNDLCVSVYNPDFRATLANHDIQRRRRVARLAHPEASECEAGRVGIVEERTSPAGRYIPIGYWNVSSPTSSPAHGGTADVFEAHPEAAQCLQAPDIILF